MATVASFTFRAMDDASIRAFFGGFHKQWPNCTREGLCNQTAITKNYSDQYRVARVGGGADFPRALSEATKSDKCDLLPVSRLDRRELARHVPGRGPGGSRAGRSGAKVLPVSHMLIPEIRKWRHTIPDVHPNL